MRESIVLPFLLVVLRVTGCQRGGADRPFGFCLRPCTCLKDRRSVGPPSRSTSPSSCPRCRGCMLLGGFLFVFSARRWRTVRNKKLSDLEASCPLYVFSIHLCGCRCLQFSLPFFSWCLLLSLLQSLFCRKARPYHFP